MKRHRRQNQEEAWIRWIRGLPGAKPRGDSVLGIGDDAALWKLPDSHQLVVTVDTQAEGTHFERDWLSPKDLGRRAVNASISDLAAMAARPLALLVALLLDERTKENYFRELYRGINQASREYSAPVIGGNVSRGPLSITVTALGSGKPRELCRRDGMRSGQEIWVSGTPGLARLGLMALRGDIHPLPRTAAMKRALGAFLRPSARVREAVVIRRRWKVGAMIDLSDGLGADLRHLVEATSRRRAVGIELDAAALDSLEPLASLAASTGQSPVETALAASEDYELCFAATPERQGDRLARSFEKRFGLKLTRIGRVVERAGLWVVVNGKRHPVVETGFEHFRRGK